MLNLDELIAAEQEYQYVRTLNVAKLAVWLYGFALVMMGAGYLVGRAIR